jgi:hypothetical protein
MPVVTIEFDRAACKSAAKRVKARLSALGHPVALGAAYEAVAAVADAPEWNVLASRLDVPSAQGVAEPNAVIVPLKKTVVGLHVPQQEIDAALEEAIDVVDARYVAVALAAGANPNGGRLHEAAANGSPKVVGLLIDAGADVGEKNKAGQTALDVAREWGRRYEHPAAAAEQYDAVVDLLLRRCANLGLAPDPVHRKDAQWWFWDEVWCDRVGPYPDEAAARKGVRDYCEKLDASPSDEDRAALEEMWIDEAAARYMERVKDCGEDEAEQHAKALWDRLGADSALKQLPESAADEDMEDWG